MNARKSVSSSSMASRSGAKPSEVAAAVNNLLHLEETDQASLLEVIEDYFTMPESSTSELLSESDSDESENETDQLEGKANTLFILRTRSNLLAGSVIQEEAVEEEEREFVDTEERVQEVLAKVVAGETGIGVEVVTGEREVGVEERQEDMDERSAFMALLKETCGCQKGVHSQPCSLQFTAEQVCSIRDSCSELGRAELDMVVMGQLMAGLNDDNTTNPVSRNCARERLRASYTLLHRGRGGRCVRGCSDFFTK